jgi:hypothetical protein
MYVTVPFTQGQWIEHGLLPNCIVLVPCSHEVSPQSSGSKTHVWVVKDGLRRQAFLRCLGKMLLNYMLVISLNLSAYSLASRYLFPVLINLTNRCMSHNKPPSAPKSHQYRTSSVSACPRCYTLDQHSLPTSYRSPCGGASPVSGTRYCNRHLFDIWIRLFNTIAVDQ